MSKAQFMSKLKASLKIIPIASHYFLPLNMHVS